MTTRMNGSGVIVIDEVMYLIEFDCVITRTGDPRFQPQRLHFSGHISHAEPADALISASENTHIPFDEWQKFIVVCEVGINKNWFGKITCRNCFFTGGTPPLKSETNGLVPCDLSFDVVNPNEDIEFKFLEGTPREQE